MQAAEYAKHQWSDLKQFDARYIRTPFPNHACAVSLKDQTVKWKYERSRMRNLVPIIFCDSVSRGLAYGDGESLVKKTDITRDALDAETRQRV